MMLCMYKECGAVDSVWTCLTCGIFSCGRYVKAHGLQHFNAHCPLHALCMNAADTSVFCYLCDDFVFNDTTSNDIAAVRHQLTAVVNGCKTATNDQEFVKADAIVAMSNSPSISPPEEQQKPERQQTKATRRRYSASDVTRRRSASYQKHAIGGASSDVDEPTKSTGASLLPNDRKASIAVARQCIGLRNLGNTCFMSAVLQALSNIDILCRRLRTLSFDSITAAVATSDTIAPEANASPCSGVPKRRRSSRLQGATSSLDLASGESDATALFDGQLMSVELSRVLLPLSKGIETAANAASSNSNNVIRRPALTPDALFQVIWRVVPRFRGYQQQDAHEFLRYLLDRFHTELVALQSHGYTSSESIVTSIFGGQLRSVVTCCACSATSAKIDPYLDLSIDIPSWAGFGDGHDQPSLTDCLTKFTSVERLAETERFFCTACAAKRTATKKLTIERLPQVLCLQVKRFRFQSSPSGRWSKIDTHVAFPVEHPLDMAPFRSSFGTADSVACNYKLSSVIVHHGSGAASGHYTAYVKRDGSWVHCDDATVGPSSADVVARAKAYILFYVRVGGGNSISDTAADAAVAPAVTAAASPATKRRRKSLR